MVRTESAVSHDAFAGCLVGTAACDAVGLPAEGLSRLRVDRRFPGPWRHRFLFGHGMWSDDTEHAFLVAQALLGAGADVEAFRRRLAWKLRWWFLGLPAGVGLATAKACLRLWLGWPPARSGVRSAGNGPCMRAPLLGVVFARLPDRRRAFVEASTRLTHRDPRALTAALSVAEVAAALAAGGDVEDVELLGRLRALAPADREWSGLTGALEEGLGEGLDVRSFAGRLGLERGVTGYAYHTAPVAIFAVLRHRDDARAALEGAWSSGGDTDTVGAIAGALLGVRHGEAAFPADWVEGLWEWPRTLRHLRLAAERLAGPEGEWRPVRYLWPLLPLRNVVFLAVVFAHGFRRLLPS